MRNRPGFERYAVASVVAACAGLAGYVGLRGIGLPPLAAALLIVACAAAGILLLAPRLPASLDGIRRTNAPLTIAWSLLALIAIVQTARLSAFMLDPGAHQHSILPGDAWLVKHCCLTAYSESARLAVEGDPNVYKVEHFADRTLGPFTVDLFHYPPTFLLLPIAVRALAQGDFIDVRAIWFSASALALILAIGSIALRLEKEGQLRVIGTAPLIWCSMPVLVGLQMSNVQILVVSIAAIALALFPRRAAAGGTVLAMSIVAKIFPGILFVYLLARRKWREAAWTAGAGLALTGVAILVVGLEPFRAFIEYELPRLSSGEAFAKPFSRAFGVARNMAPFGIPLKLGALGFPGMTLEIARVVSLVYLVCVVALAVWSGRRLPRTGTETASLWLSLISLGTLASPFAPSNYVLVSVVWLVCMNRELFRLPAVIVVWLLISLPFLISRDAPFLIQAAASFPSQALAIGVPVVILWNAGTARAYETGLAEATAQAEEIRPVNARAT